MPKQFHILNGDALKIQLPPTILGEIIVARECLVDGDTNGNTFEELFSARAKFLCNTLENFSEADYNKTSGIEFKRMQQIPENAEINLWFEDDLFCQVNLWFVIYLLKENNKKYLIHLVRPNPENKYSFGRMSKIELQKAYKNRTSIELNDFHKLARLWNLYQQNELDKMIKISKETNNNFPFLEPAIQAHKLRIPNNGNPGKPIQTIIQIIDELKTCEFAPIFKEFCKREAIYGFGDLQVKRLLDVSIKESQKKSSSN